MVKHLHDMFGMDTKAAEWAINTWAEVLGIHLTQTCIADFTLSPANGTAPLSVQCTDSSKGKVTRYEWDFGDKERSTEKNPEHTYRSPGTYTITLRAYHDSFLSEKTLSEAVTVTYPELKGAVSSSVQNGEVPLTVEFTSSGKGLVKSFDWDFGDGNHSEEQNPVHQYNSTGSYQVRLTISDGNSTIQIDLPNPIVVTPEKVRAEFSSSLGSSENPLLIQFSNQSKGNPDTFHWDFGDGTQSDEENPPHEYTQPGKYMVTFTASNNETGEKDTITREIPVDIVPCVAGFSVDIPEGVAPLTVTFTNQSTGFIKTIEWDFGDGTTSSDRDSVHVYEKPGRYTVDLVISDGKNKTRSLKKSAVIARPSNLNADFTCTKKWGHIPLQTSFSSKYSVPEAKYHWTFGDGTESHEQNPKHTYEKEGTYSVTLKVYQDDFFKEEKKKDFITVKPDLSAATKPVATKSVLKPVKEVNLGDKSSKPVVDNKGSQNSSSQKVPETQLVKNNVNFILIGIIGLIIVTFFIIATTGGFSGINSQKPVSQTTTAPQSTQISSPKQTSSPVSNCRLGPSCDCENAALSGRDLSGYGLLNGNLRNADLSNAKLKGTVLRNTDLSGANLKGADLTGALIIGANLKNADLQDTTIDETIFTGSDLSGVNFNGAEIILSDFSNTNLKGASFYHVDMGKMNIFAGADLSGATWLYGNTCPNGAIGKCV